MRAISAKVKKQLEADPEMRRCALRWFSFLPIGSCGGRIEWHHVWIYAGKQIDEAWAILGACEAHHDQVNKNPLVKKLFEWVSIMKSKRADLEKYPRKDWDQIISSTFAAIRGQ